MVPPVERRRLRARGIVQGVGFRPFVHRLATAHGLGGFVLNDGEGVVIEVEGAGSALDAFAEGLVGDAPLQARVDSVVAEPLAASGGRGFEIRLSAAAAPGTAALVPPDLATCGDCLRELFDPADRRHRYPFLNCTQCGPRLTIVRGVPYDRARTTMDRFALCPDCRREYEDPADRRFHAEPIACPVCGPRLSLPLERAVELLANGAIVAVKGLGGWHLACDATDEGAVARLRAGKHREEKPFALMTGDPDGLCLVDDEERALLASAAAPIVLLRRRDPGVAPSVAPGASRLGVMLPYTPLHHLIWHDLARPFVLTSGNLSDEPIVVDDAEARHRLGSIADAFVGHDRPIHRRCEDSVVERGRVLRRSRGYAPSALPLPVESPAPIVAAGGELKATFCVARGREAFLSPHLGDLGAEPAFRAYRNDLALYLEMLRVEPAIVACDLHPEYLSTKWASELGLPVRGVQHHHAHAAACLGEHGVEEALALVFDGTGYGLDGTLWGGELLHARLGSFTRVAHLAAMPLPGGEAAVREPWRMAAVHLERAGLPVPWPRWEAVRESLEVNAPLSSGMGRLFDAVAALLGVRERVSYEGQAAIELERLAEQGRGAAWSWRFGDGTELVAECHRRLRAGGDRADIARGFHATVARAAADACAEAGRSETVVLTGGTFQNRLLARDTRDRLEGHGFRVLEHVRVPANDGGLSYGQAVVTACA